MNLDICFNNGNGPIQIQQVRWTTVYPESLGHQKPEIVIHFKDYSKAQQNIPLEIIYSLNISND